MQGKKINATIVKKQNEQQPSKYWLGFIKSHLWFSLLVTLFFGLCAGLIIMTRYVSFQLAEDAKLLNLAARQHTLANTIQYSLEGLNKHYINGGDFDGEVEQKVEALKEATDLFNGTLIWLEHGGKVTSNDHTMLEIKGLEEAQFKTLFAKAQHIWQPYLATINPLVNAEAPDVSEIQTALTYSIKNYNQLLLVMDDLTKEIDASIHGRALSLHQLQWLCVSLIALIFLALITMLLSELANFNQKANITNALLRNIEETTDSSTLSLNAGLKVSGMVSDQLQRLLGIPIKPNQAFANVLNAYSPQSKMAIEKFIKQLKLSLNYQETTGNYTVLPTINLTDVDQKKHVQFRLKPNLVGEVIFVYVQDVTTQKQLLNSVKQDKVALLNQSELFTTLARMPNASLQEFLSVTRRQLFQIDEQLKKIESLTDHASSMHQILNLLHAIKAEAQKHDIHSFIDATHNLQLIVSRCAARPEEAEAEMLAVVCMLKALLDQLAIADNFYRQTQSQPTTQVGGVTQLVEMHVFIDAIKAYFRQAYGDEVKIKSAYLTSKLEADVKDYTAKVNVSGKLQAGVYFSANKITMMQMLIAAGDTNPSDATISKAFNPIVASLKATVSQFFLCETTEISVANMTNSDMKMMATRDEQPYVVKLMWRNQEISMLFDDV